MLEDSADLKTAFESDSHAKAVEACTKSLRSFVQCCLSKEDDAKKIIAGEICWAVGLCGRETVGWDHVFLYAAADATAGMNRRWSATVPLCGAFSAVQPTVLPNSAPDP